MWICKQHRSAAEEVGPDARSAVECSAGHVLSKSAKETKAFSAVSACSPSSSTYVASVEMSTITGANDHALQPAIGIYTLMQSM